MAYERHQNYQIMELMCFFLEHYFSPYMYRVIWSYNDLNILFNKCIPLDDFHIHLNTLQSITNDHLHKYQIDVTNCMLQPTCLIYGYYLFVCLIIYLWSNIFGYLLLGKKFQWVQCSNSKYIVA